MLEFTVSKIYLNMYIVTCEEDSIFEMFHYVSLIILINLLIISYLFTHTQIQDVYNFQK